MPEMHQEPEVTVDSLSTSLDDLIKAADATALIKGGGSDSNRVEHTGTKGSDGEQGGGRGSYPGNAEIDRMMIGKLADLGFDASQISAMSAALVGKQEDEDEDEDDEEAEFGKLRAYMKGNGGSMKGYKGFGKSGDDGAEGEPMVKSLDQFRQDPDIADAIDVSPYLEAMTARTAEQIDAVTTELAKGFGNQTTVNRAIAGALHQMGTLAKSQSVVIDELAARLGIVERTPQPQRGVTGAQGLQKSMPGEVGARGGDKQLSKSEVLSTLSYMNLEKGIKNIDGQSTSQAIGMLEGGGVVSESVIKAAHNFHIANPNESEVARQYH